MDSNVTVSGDQGGFFQSGGAHVISNLLAVSGWSPQFSGYVLSGGQLTAQNIQVSSGATFHHTGGALVNPGMLTLVDGNWQANTNQQQLGQLVVANSTGGNSMLILPAGACVLRFADSSGAAWSGQLFLSIENWTGSVMGGGHHQVFFGSSAAGLTPQQLAQIQFHNPGGVSGAYPATLLSTGEIVPAQFLGSHRAGNDLVLEWGSGFVLQTATNAAGPYADVSGASTPYTIHPAGPRRFFRLRR